MVVVLRLVNGKRDVCRSGLFFHGGMSGTCVEGDFVPFFFIVHVLLHPSLFLNEMC